MKARYIVEIFIIPFLLSLPILAQSAEIRSGDRIEITGNYSDNLFAAGRIVDIDVQSIDDIFLAGRQVFFRGTSHQSVFAAGGEVTIDNSKMRELLAAGGQVKVMRAEIGDDVLAAGGEVVFSPLSRVHGTVKLAGQDVFLNGTMEGDVDVRANRLRIGPQASISGNLTHRTSSIEIDPSARIGGQTFALSPESTSSTLAMIGGFLFFLGTFLVAPILAVFFRRTVSGGAERIYQEFWQSLGKGTLVALLVPLIWVGLFISAVGAPLAFTLLPVVALGVILAWTTAIYTIGTWMRAQATRHRGVVSASRLRVFGWTLLASFLAMLVLAIPLAGALFGIVAFLTGVGALYSHLRNHGRQRPADTETRETEAA